MRRNLVVQHAKQKDVKFAKSAQESAGDVWTWTGIDADSKLIVSWHVGDRSQWLSVSDQMRTRDDFDRLITSRLNGFYGRLTMAGF